MTFELVTTVDTFRAACDRVRASGGTIGLVPTMGALHVGHTSLFAAAHGHASHVAATIFVNPTQFGPNEDFNRYPRDLDGDLAKCRDAGVSMVFAPAAAEMYPPGEQTRVRVDGLTDHLCGPFRPGHFEGVATIVTKLFGVTGACTAVFGRKDYQQLKVIERLARDLLLPVRVLSHPTVREADGLAMSSRNAYLSADERRVAVEIPRALSDTVRAFIAGERHVATLRVPVARRLEHAEMTVEYVTIADPNTLEPIDDSTTLEGPALAAVAVRIGKTRLIDNVVLGEDAAPISGGHA
jgi:pantoate--beta-alanine ligase